MSEVPMVPDTHPKTLVALHWAMAAALVGMLAVGFLMTRADPDGPARLWLSRAHVALGVSVGLGLVTRLVVRTRSVTAPLPMPAPRAALKRVVQGGLYAVLFALIASGISTCLLGDWSSYVVFGTTLSAPDLSAIRPRQGHGIFVYVLLGLVATHVAGVVLYEARIGGALRRMLPTRG
jgi:cytochrome b561